MSDQHPFHIAKSLEYGWDVLSRRWVALVLWTIILWIPHAMINTASMIFAFVAVDHQSPWFLKVISVAVNVITFMLYTRVVLLCMDDDPAGIGDVLSGFKFLIPFTIASLFFFLLVLVGSVALIVPGIYIGLATGLYSFLIVDQFMGPLEALKRSFHITKGHLLQLAFLYFVLCMVIFGGLICFVVGVIPASIVSTVALADVYRRLDQAYDQVNEGEDAGKSALKDESEPEEEIAG
jgi:hypothetical protein